MCKYCDELIRLARNLEKSKKEVGVVVVNTENGGQLLYHKTRVLSFFTKQIKSEDNFNMMSIQRCPFCHVDLEFKLQQAMTPTEMVVVKKLGLCTINELCLKCINNVSCDDCQMKDILNGRLCKVLKLLVQEIPNQDIFNVDIKLTGGDKND